MPMMNQHPYQSSEGEPMPYISPECVCALMASICWRSELKFCIIFNVFWSKINLLIASEIVFNQQQIRQLKYHSLHANVPPPPSTIFYYYLRKYFSIKYSFLADNIFVMCLDFIFPLNSFVNLVSASLLNVERKKKTFLFFYNLQSLKHHNIDVCILMRPFSLSITIKFTSSHNSTLCLSISI